MSEKKKGRRKKTGEARAVKRRERLSLHPDMAIHLLEGILSLPVVSFRIDSKGFVTEAMGEGLKTVGLKDNELVGRRAQDIFPESGHVIDRALSGWSGTFEGEGVYKEEPWKFVNYLTPERNGDGVLGFSLDISEHYQAELALRESEARFRALAEAASEGIVVHDGEKILLVNPAACRMLRAKMRELVGAVLFDYVAESSHEHVQQAIEHDVERRYRVIMRRKDGSQFPAEVVGRSYEFQNRRARVATIRDMSVHRRAARLTRANRRLTKLSFTDGLTELNNRRHFDDELTQRLEAASETQEKIGLLLLDVDRFKAVNDKYGHPVGDAVLQRLAEVLREFQRSSDFSARYGGEEFAIILRDSDAADARTAGERLRQMVEMTSFDACFEGAKKPPNITISVGVASFPENADGPEALVDAADRALYQAKQNGRNRVEVADNES